MVEPNNRPFVANANTPFYVSEGCILCNAPETTAPDLIATAKEDGELSKDSDTDYSCFIKRQPSSKDEIELIAEAMQSSCVECLRYRGTNADVIEILSNNDCKHLCDAIHECQAEEKTKRPWWKLW